MIEETPRKRGRPRTKGVPIEELLERKKAKLKADEEKRIAQAARLAIREKKKEARKAAFAEEKAQSKDFNAPVVERTKPRRNFHCACDSGYHVGHGHNTGEPDKAVKCREEEFICGNCFHHFKLSENGVKDFNTIYAKKGHELIPDLKAIEIYREHKLQADLDLLYEELNKPKRGLSPIVVKNNKTGEEKTFVLSPLDAVLAAYGLFTLHNHRFSAWELENRWGDKVHEEEDRMICGPWTVEIQVPKTKKNTR